MFKKYLTVVFFPFQILTAQDLVDFSPVYRCLHIYTVLVGALCHMHIMAFSDWLTFTDL